MTDSQKGGIAFVVGAVGGLMTSPLQTKIRRKKK
jgi:hypothetical protein